MELPKFKHAMIQTPFKLGNQSFEITCREVMINDQQEDGMTIFFGDVLVTANVYGDNQNIADALSKVISNREIEVTFGEDEKHITTKVVNVLWANRYEGFKKFLDEHDAFEPFTPDSVSGYVYPYGLTRTMYRQTECGAWAQIACDCTGDNWLDASDIGGSAPERVKLSDVRLLRIGTIVEGSDAEIMGYDADVYWMNLDYMNLCLNSMEAKAEAAWEEANEIHTELAHQEEFGI